ncbi:MAG: type III PLP-dependent enzyme [Magnetovibrionaceae bacterium]
MTPKIERFLSERQPATPCLVVDLQQVEENYRTLRDGLPLADIYYAVKANPARPILNMLVGLGSHFDAASHAEVEMCLAAGAEPEKISFGNTVKKASDIKASFDAGVRVFAFDSAEELEKLSNNAPGAKVYCRILTSSAGADWPLSRKFGCELDMARDLMLKARDLGLDPYGISFHVGSQQLEPSAWDLAIARTAMVFSDLAAAGLDLRMVNLGGGYPARYNEDIPPFRRFADAIMEALTRHFGNDLPELIMEPGRSIVAQAGVIETEVVLVSNKAYDQEKRWVYLDIGLFGGLAETMGEAIRYAFSTPHDGTESGPVAIAGPTCDGADILYEETEYHLPMALKAGDRVRIKATGAYTTTYASVGFNGFEPLTGYYI